MVFAIHWHESAMDLHVFPIPIPPPASLPIPSLWVFPVHQPWALVSCIQPGLVICFTLDSILVSILFSQNIPPSPSPTESKSLFCTSVSLFLYICVSISERDTCTPMFITALFIIARTWKQPRCPSADECIRKLWYLYTMEYYSAIKKNSFESVLMRWMKLEPIIQREVSQKDKDQYSILTHKYGI